MSDSLIPGLENLIWNIEDHASLIGGVWMPRGPAPSEVSYPESARDPLADIEASSLWFQSRNLIIQTMLRHHTDATHLLDVGAGNGTVAAHRARNGIETIAVEPGLAGARNCAARGIKVAFAGHLAQLALPSESVAAVGLFDVIEHIEDPSELLAEVNRVLKPGGWCVLTVPALQFLWSQADEHAGHFRRYSRRSLEAAMTARGFDRRFSSYCFAAAVPFLFLLRSLPYRRGRRLSNAEIEESALRELSNQGRVTTLVGRAATLIECWCMRWLPIPFGTSIVAIYKKT
jgi:SAM-dependent methyltransferase